MTQASFDQHETFGGAGDPLRFWRAQAGAAASCSRLTEHLHADGEGARELRLSEDALSILRRIAKGQPLGELVVLLSALVILFERISGDRVIRIDSPPLTDDSSFVLPLVFQVPENASIKELVGHVRQVVAQSYEYQHVPLSMLGMPPRGDVLVTHEALHPARVREHEIVITLRAGGTLALTDARGVVTSAIVTCVDAILRRFDAPSTALADLDVLGDEERRAQLEDFNRTAEPAYLAVGSLTDVFAGQVARTPDAIAVICGNVELTYAALDARANVLASHLVTALDVRPGDAVPVLTGRSEWAIVALLGVLKAGAVYVPLNPRQSYERLCDIVRETRARAVLVDADHLRLALECPDVPAFCLDMQMQSLGETAPPPSGARVEDVAAVIYTSGSEGRPKGVLLDHRGLVNVALDHVVELRMSERDRYLQFMSLAFDGSLLDIFTALLSGAALVLVGDDVLRDLPALHETMERTRVSVFTMTPSFLKLLDWSRLPEVRAVVSAAEPARGSDAELHSRERVFYNGYGPTEGCVNATLHRADPARRYATVPVGRARANKQVYVVDERLRLLPRGAIGEIAISGAISRGYFEAPDLTTRKFVPHPFRPGERLYLTGDLGAWDARGDLHFKGRRDSQVKLRGFRVEPGEVEAVLLAHASVRDAVAAVDTQRQQMLAFVVPADAVREAELSAHLRSRVPDYMMPAAIHLLDSFPLTPNGKIDREALLVRAATAPPAEENAPVDELERELASIWCAVLEVPSIGVDDDFFRRGGDSIRIIQVVHEARGRGIAVDTFEIIRNPTIRRLGASVRANGLDAQAAAIPAPALPEDVDLRAGEDFADVYPVSRMQELLLARYAEPELAAEGVYHCVSAWRFADPALSIDALRAAAAALVRRHRSLRTVFFRTESGRLLQGIRTTPNVPILEHDPDPAHRFAVGDGSFARIHIVRRGPDEAELTLTIHHAIIDGWSGVELENDLFALYAAAKAGLPLDDRPLAVDSYKEFVALEQELERSEKHARFWAGELQRIERRRLPRRYDDRGFASETAILSEDAGRAFFGGVGDGVSLKAACLARFADALHASLGESNLTIGIVVNGRSDRLTEPLRATGLFWNIVPFSMDRGAGSRAEDVQQRLNAIEPFAAYPLARLQEDANERELFDVCFNFTQFHNVREPGVHMLEVRANDKFHFPLTFIVSAEGGRIEVRAEYDRGYFSGSDVRQIIERFGGSA